MIYDKKRMIRILWGFLAIMAAASVTSRAAASLLVAQVNVEKTVRGRLLYTYEGEGIVAPVQENQIFLWPEQQVEWTAKQGTQVKSGECLVRFRMEYLQQLIDKKQAELTQMELQASQQQVSAREQARVPAVTGAGQALTEAQRQLDAARQKAEDAERMYHDFVDSAESAELDKNIIENIIEDDDGPENGSENRYDSGQESAGLGVVPGNTQDDAWQLRKQELESALQEAYAGVESAMEEVNQAQNAYELAEQEDKAQDINAANAAEAARLGAEASKVQIDYTRRELERLKGYQAAEGKICADRDCTVLKVGVEVGAVTSGSEVFVIGSGGFQLKGRMKAKDKEKLKAGQEAEVQLGAGKKKTVRFESIETDTGGAAGGIGATDGGASGGNTDTGGSAFQEAQIFWLASVPENTEVKSGDTFTWQTEIPTEKEYEQMIPLGALREGVNETYCLVLAEEEQMLGTVQTAKKVPVTVLEKDAKNAAITSTLSIEDKVIVSSEKYVAEGDRVRLKE